jgi:DNA polymerase III delta prime subunit
MSNEYLWVEKYRPTKISQCILPKDIKTTFQAIVDTGELPNMLLTGTAGLGKTTVAKALCKELELDYIIINGSEDGNIDTLRGKIKQFASTVSLQGGYKVVILDEADYLNPQSTQPALRGFIEEFSSNCRFILTCNFKNRIIEPLHSRCGVYEFNTSRKNMPQLAGLFHQRLLGVLKSEGIAADEKAAADLVLKFAPDWRRVLNEAQRQSVHGNNIMHSSIDDSGNISDLINTLKAKDFKKMRSWIANHMDVDASAIFRNVYDAMGEHIAPHCIPGVVLILADYQYKNAFVADHELNVVACMTEIMSNVEFN